MSAEIDSEPLRAARSGFRSADAIIAALAAEQNGRAARWQLVERGVTRHMVQTRVESGMLIPEFPGVYAVGHREVGALGAWTAAALCGGPDSALSFTSATAIRGVLPDSQAYSHVTSPRAHARTAKVRWHRCSLADDEVELVRGVATTTIHRTLIDIASIVETDVLERVLHRVEQRRITDPVPLPELLERHRGRRGVANLKRALAQRVESAYLIEEFEDRFRQFLIVEGLPLPTANISVDLPDDFVVPDCVWPEQRLIVELDSRRHHLGPDAFERDRERDIELTVAGWTVIRVTWRRLHEDRARLAAHLRTLLSVV